MVSEVGGFWAWAWGGKEYTCKEYLPSQWGGYQTQISIDRRLPVGGAQSVHTHPKKPRVNKDVL